MKKLRFKESYNHHHDYTDDIQRIIKVFADRGYEISESGAIGAWESFSSSMAAGWLILPESDESIYNEIREYFEEVE